MKTPAQRLDALTTLRFVAAALIVLFHIRGFFGLPANLGADRFLFPVGVTFFFVMSGFILAHVYSSLDSWPQRARFLRARIARVWPAHAFSFLLLFVLLEHPLEGPMAHAGLYGLLNLCMVQTWVPIYECCTSYNSVSWSIATEFAFYFAFLWLIRRWDRTWHWKLVLVALLTAGLARLCRRFVVARYPFLTAEVLLYFSPAGRLFEFTLGMATALLYRRIADRSWRPGRLLGTVVEVAVIALVIGFHYWATGPEAARLARNGFGDAGPYWLRLNGGCFVFALLVLTMALEWGWIAGALACRPCVLLGEISYSVYLLHHMLLRWYFPNRDAFAGVSQGVQLIAYWLVLLLLSSVTWSVVERPLRELLGGRRRPAPRSHAGRSLLDRLMAPGPVTIAMQLGLLAALLAPILYLAYRLPYEKLTPDRLAMVVAASLPEARDVHFGDDYILRGASVGREGAKLFLRLVWQSCKDQRLDRVVVVQPRGPNRGPEPNADHVQDWRQRPVHDGDVWVEKVKLPSSVVRGADYLAVGLWSAEDGWLPADRGPRETSTQLILLPLLAE